MPVKSETKNQIEGEVEVCCHRVAYRYWDFGGLFTDPQQITADDIKERMQADAESRAKELINDGCSSGELCFYYHDEATGKEYEPRGWWEIIRE